MSYRHRSIALREGVRLSCVNSPYSAAIEAAHPLVDHASLTALIKRVTFLIRRRSRTFFNSHAGCRAVCFDQHRARAAVRRRRLTSALAFLLLGDAKSVARRPFSSSPPIAL